MRRVVLESPYAGDQLASNVRYARRALRDCLDRGEAPIASHLLYTQPGVLNDQVPEDRAKGMAAGLVWAYFAEAAVFYVDRGWSNGMLEARDFYAANGTPVEVRSLGEAGQ